jgi:hypothetical protein
LSSPVDEALADLARAFDALAVPWYLFGAQAAILYGATRVTEDIDVTIDLGNRAPTEFVSALERFGFDLRFAAPQTFVERTRVFPFTHIRTGMPVDIVVAGPGLEELFFSRIQKERREGQTLPVASPEDLIVMKILAGRPHDHEDIRSILRASGAKLERATIEATLALLEEALGQSDLRPAFRALDDDTPAPRTRAPRSPTRKALPPKRKPPKRAR